MALIATFVSQLVTLGAVFAILWALEVLFPKEKHSVTSRLRGAVYWALSSVITVGAAVGFFVAWRALGLKPLVVLDLTPLPGGPIIGVLAAAILGDFAFYWMHRAQHKWFWRFHAVHHSIEEMNGIASYTHVSEGLFRVVFIVAPGALFMTRAQGEAWLGFVLTLQGLYLHSCTRIHLGPLRYVVGDNLYHRIHHSRDPKHYDKNFSGFSPIWDVLFGTVYFPKPDEWPKTGLSGVSEPVAVTDYIWRPFHSSTQE